MESKRSQTRSTARTAVLAGVLVACATGEARAFAGTPTAADLALFKCQRAITKETTKATATAAKVFRKVLDAGVKDYHTRADITAKTEDLVVASLRKVLDTRALGSSIQEKTEARIVSACDPRDQGLHGGGSPRAPRRDGECAAECEVPRAGLPHDEGRPRVDR
jgi:hypothetical protein